MFQLSSHVQHEALFFRLVSHVLPYFAYLFLSYFPAFSGHTTPKLSTAQANAVPNPWTNLITHHFLLLMLLLYHTMVVMTPQARQSRPYP
jgi:hypothetical protein